MCARVFEFVLIGAPIASCPEHDNNAADDIDTTSADKSTSSNVAATATSATLLLSCWY